MVDFVEYKVKNNSQDQLTLLQLLAKQGASWKRVF